MADIKSLSESSSQLNWYITLHDTLTQEYIVLISAFSKNLVRRPRREDYLLGGEGKV